MEMVTVDILRELLPSEKVIKRAKKNNVLVFKFTDKGAPCLQFAANSYEDIRKTFGRKFVISKSEFSYSSNPIFYLENKKTYFLCGIKRQRISELNNKLYEEV